MSKSLQWLIGIGVVLVVASMLVSNLWPLIAFRSGWAGADGWGMMGGGSHMRAWGGGMMGGIGGFGAPFMGLSMLFWPVVIIGLVVLGVTWLVRAVRPAAPGASPVPPPAVTTPCAHCGQPLQAGWRACPYCGEKV